MSGFKTYDDLYRAVLELFPQAEMGEDVDEQLVVYTHMTMTEEGEIKPHVYVDPTDEDEDQFNDD